MTAFPTAADCMRLVALGSNDPGGIQFDAALSLLYGTGCLPSELGLLKIVDIVRAERQAEVCFAGAPAGVPVARCVILSGRVKSVVERHLDTNVGPPERLVFQS